MGGTRDLTRDGTIAAKGVYRGPWRQTQGREPDWASTESRATTVTRQLSPGEEQEKTRSAGGGLAPKREHPVGKAQKQDAAAGEPWCVTSGPAGEAAGVRQTLHAHPGVV